MKVALPYRLHGHQHGALDNAVCQGGYTQRTRLTISFRDIDSLDRFRAVGARQQVRPQIIQMLVQTGVQPLLVHSVNSRCSRAARRQNDPGRLGQPLPIGNETQKTIKPPGPVISRPCCELVLHFADYQRSSPRSVS